MIRPLFQIDRGVLQMAQYSVKKRTPEKDQFLDLLRGLHTLCLIGGLALPLHLQVGAWIDKITVSDRPWRLQMAYDVLFAKRVCKDSHFGRMSSMRILLLPTNFETLTDPHLEQVKLIVPSDFTCATFGVQQRGQPIVKIPTTFTFPISFIF